MDRENFSVNNYCVMKDNQIMPARGSADAHLPPHANPSQHILLVDDDFYVRELNAGVLIRFGYKVDTAGNGADAWDAINEQSYDLLITDNRMPRVTGLELIKKLCVPKT